MGQEDEKGSQEDGRAVYRPLRLNQSKVRCRSFPSRHESSSSSSDINMTEINHSYSSIRTNLEDKVTEFGYAKLKTRDILNDNIEDWMSKIRCENILVDPDCRLLLLQPM